MDRHIEQAINFIGKPEDKLEAIKVLDRSLKLYGDLKVYGNLSDGIEALSLESIIHIEELSEKYQVIISPKSGAGHDFTFQVDKHSGEILNVMIGIIAPAPKPFD